MLVRNFNGGKPFRELGSIIKFRLDNVFPFIIYKTAFAPPSLATTTAAASPSVNAKVER